MKSTAVLPAAMLVAGLSVSVAAQGPMPPPPGPEHEILKKDVGTWDATIEMTLGPGMPPMTMTGVEKSTLVAARWLVTEFEAEMMGQRFEGRGIGGWDPEKKAYVAVWVDSMATELSHSESTYDPQMKALTGWMDMRDPMGGRRKAKTVEEWPDAETRVVRIYMTADTPEPFMRMTYRKRK